MKRLLYPLVAITLAASLNAKTLSDAEGRKVTLPDRVDKVFGSSPPMTYLMYTLNPDKMVGLNFKAKNPNNGAEEPFIDRKFLSLPVIGSFHGGGQGINLETLIGSHPQMILLWQDDMMVKTVRQEIDKTGIPYVMVPFRKINDMPKAFRLAGEAIGESERGNTLARYADNVIDEVSKAARSEKAARYYYAEGLDGLSTECDQSFHVEALNFAGGENVHKCQQHGLLGLEKITFETLLKYDPDVIVVQNRSVYNDLINDPMWKSLRAVKNGRIHLVPVQPFNWIDRPPSFMRVIGVQWLTSVFHPNAYKANLHQRIKEFYKLYLRVEVNEAQIKTLLGEEK
ncbi:MAG: ABC transporter substrate-binding protein [Sulfuricurvum sp.]